MHRLSLLIVALGLVSACESNDAPVALAAIGSAPASSSALAPSAAASATAIASASASASATASEPPAVDWTNKVAHVDGSEELTARARALFDAIVADDPTLAEPFWFPKEPFIPLKDVKDPGKYWGNLHKAYANDVHTLHRKRKSWEGAEFVRYSAGSRPTWVKPGDEYNKIGYYRSFNGHIHYKVGERESKIEVHTLITWQGLWYVTHLHKVRK